MSINRFNLTNPLSWFLLEDYAKTTPILRFAQEQALRVKPMFCGLPFGSKVKKRTLEKKKENCKQKLVRI